MRNRCLNKMTSYLRKLTILLLISCNSVASIDYTNSLEALRTVLLNGYSSKVRPHDGTGRQLTVTVALRPRYLEKLVESEERATLLLNVDLYWNDSRLTWSPENHLLHRCIYLELNELWSPELLFFDAISEECNLNPTYSVHVCSDGQIHLEYHCRVTIVAKFDAEAFPFDRQSVEIRFGHPSIGMEDLDLKPAQMNITEMQQVDDWFFR